MVLEDQSSGRDVVEIWVQFVISATGWMMDVYVQPAPNFHCYFFLGFPVTFDLPATKLDLGRVPSNQHAAINSNGSAVLWFTSLS